MILSKLLIKYSAIDFITNNVYLVRLFIISIKVYFSKFFDSYFINDEQKYIAIKKDQS